MKVDTKFPIVVLNAPNESEKVNFPSRFVAFYLIFQIPETVKLYVELEKRGHWSQEMEPQLLNGSDFQVKVNKSKFIIILSDAPPGTGIIVR